MMLKRRIIRRNRYDPRDQLGLLHTAWLAAGRNARKQFLSEILSPACADPAPRGPLQGRSGIAEVILPNILIGFAKARIERCPEHRVHASVLYREFKGYCRAKGEAPLSLPRVKRGLLQLGYLRKKFNAYWWLDIKLTDASGETCDHQHKNAPKRPLWELVPSHGRMPLGG